MRCMNCFGKGWVSLFSLFVLMCNQSVVYGQDSVSQKFSEKINFDLAGGGFYQAPIKDEKVRMPEYIMYKRSPTGIYYATDNPLYHGAYFIALKSNLQLTKEVTFNADFYGEHRGFSYGVYNTSNMIVYPRANLVIDKTDTLFSKPINFFVAVGNKTKTRIHEGLTLYNMDAQGWDIHLQWGKLRVNYYQLSDLKRWVGLNINDSYDATLSLEALNINSNWKNDVRFGIYNYNSVFFLDGISGLKFSSGFYNKNTRLYFEVSNRSSSTIKSFSDKSAMILGTRWKKSFKKLSFDNKLEARHYGKFYNQGYYNPFIGYRDRNKGNYANSVGEQLYPLTSTYRPLSQWALFTEYQGINVGALTLESDIKYLFRNGVFFRGVIDMNFITPSGENNFLYGLYSFDLGWEPIPDNYFALGITNKGMNLDVHYPTFYNFKNPFFNVSLSRKVNWGE
ncbi:MAG: hypothetical protein OEW75_13115 [Cyclobacteriaceae bacterium]|nr:hypothetical protein [Cyclobacteriaceae bacterium]